MSKENRSLTEEEFKTAVKYAVSKYGVPVIAKVLGVSRPTVCRWLNGENFRRPAMMPGSMKVLEKLLKESKRNK